MTEKLALAAILGLVAVSTLVAAAPSGKSFKADRVTVASTKSFDQVVGAVESLVAKNEMMVMAKVDQGRMLSMTGMRLDATLFLIGNPTIGKKLFEEDHGLGLYVPLRLFIYGGGDGKTYVSYDRPSSLLAQFDNGNVSMIAKMLDEKLAGLSTMAAN